MKKALAMALGAMLVVGSAVPASAKSQIDFSGLYRVYQLNNWNQDYQPKNKGTNDAGYFVNRLQLNFAFHATDEVSVYWRLRAPAGGRWGDATGDTALKSQYHYGEVTQDWGTVSIGRLKDDYSSTGLASLGYYPGGLDDIFTLVGPFDFDDPMDGIRYAKRWDNGFQLAALFLRPKTARKGPPDGDGNPAGKEGETNDIFAIEPAYFWDGGGAALGLLYQRDHTTSYTTPLGPIGGPDKPALKAFIIQPAIAHSWGDFSTHFEGRAAWGSIDPDFGAEAVKVNGYAFYLDLDYNYGPGNVNLAGWWSAGPKENELEEGNKISGIMGFGTAFRPLIVAYSEYANGRNIDAQNAVAKANELSQTTAAVFNDANHWALDLSGAHAFTDDLTLTYAVAYLALNKTAEGRKKNIGWETDLGLQVQLLDNLQFRTIFGYLFAGDALKESGPSGEKAKDAYNWYNTLTFSF